MTTVLDQPLVTTVTSDPLPDQIVVDVTAEDITCGARGSSLKCPVALALQRDGYPVRWVGPIAVCIKYGLHTHYLLDDEGYEFIRAFDYQEPVMPCRVVLTRGELLGVTTDEPEIVFEMVFDPESEVKEALGDDGSYIRD